MEKTSLWKVVSATALLAVAICVAAGGAFAQDDNSGPAGAVPEISSAPKATNGSVKCTASVNADGSVLACKHCNLADISHLGTGQYQIGFKKPCQNILAVNGWSRWVQPDTLSTGITVGTCTTADRAGDSNAVYVRCTDPSGIVIDTSFFLFVAR